MLNDDLISHSLSNINVNAAYAEIKLASLQQSDSTANFTGKSAHIVAKTDSKSVSVKFIFSFKSISDF
jgi:hypothetical protein